MNMKWIARVSAGLLALGLGAHDAWAVVGRPLTPMSYAGVARRSARRTAYVGGAAYAGAAVATTVAVGARVATLPPGCAFAATVYRCGGYIYRPVYDGPDVVYVVEQG